MDNPQKDNMHKWKICAYGQYAQMNNIRKKSEKQEKERRRIKRINGQCPQTTKCPQKASRARGRQALHSAFLRAYFHLRAYFKSSL